MLLRGIADDDTSSGGRGGPCAPRFKVEGLSCVLIRRELPSPDLSSADIVSSGQRPREPTRREM